MVGTHFIVHVGRRGKDLSVPPLKKVIHIRVEGLVFIILEKVNYKIIK